MQIRGAMKDWISHRRTVRKWHRAARMAPGMSLDQLQELRVKARDLHAPINQFFTIADGRLSQPLPGSDVFQNPHGTDWAWRPELWRLPLAKPGISSIGNGTNIGPDVKIFHDCPRSEITIRQLRNRRASDLAPFGLKTEVFAFEGSFLSLVLDLPQVAVEGLQARHLIRLDAIIELEKPMKLSARLNVRHGPNTVKIIRDLPQGKPNVMVEFDLAYSDLNENRLEGAWIDLIFEDPAMSQVILHDLSFSRRLRAEL
ncbi:FIG00993084: hypothetical protein [hydrothermal vent metagenome]|uniref:Uncharacterized protein n=1 Tax=hydrothermal vent metagenome TaxID=652676 RepID=A0A3B0S6L9_9ZZZZ